MTPRTHYTPAEVARQRGVSDDKVLAMIHAGELHAIDMRSPGSRRPRWRISTEALEAFDLRRGSGKPIERVRPRRQPGSVIEFY